MDISCALCGEPWDCKSNREAYDMEPHENKLFRAGKGCPCCDFGKSLPLEGQYEAIRGPLSVWRDFPHVYKDRYNGVVTVLSGSMDKTTLECVPGMIANVEYIEYEGPGSYLDPAVIFTYNNEQLACTEKDFRRMFPKKIETEADRQNKLNLEFRAAQEAMDATDEDPMEVLIERDLIWFSFVV